MTYQTNTKQIRLDNAKLDQDFVEANKESTNNINIVTILNQRSIKIILSSKKRRVVKNT